MDKRVVRKHVNRAVRAQCGEERENKNILIVNRKENRQMLAG